MGKAPHPGRAIVTYGRSLMALTIAHSLGRRGVEVIGCDDVGLTALSFSKYAKKHFTHARAADRPEQFIADLEAAIIRHKPKDERPYVLIPCFAETRLIAAHAERFAPHIRIAAPPIEAIRAVDPKDALLRTARALQLPIPPSWTGEEIGAGERPDEDLYPLIVKPARGVGGRGVRRITSSADLAQALAQQRGGPLIVQRYVPGEDYCLTALYDRGVRKASAAYRNLSRYPREAGAGVLRETVPETPFLAAADALFGAVGWTGVVEADFRWDGSGEPILIEVNPRFWAGLFHTVASGVDFPWMLFELAAKGEIAAAPEPKLGQRTKVGALHFLAAVQEIAESDASFAAVKDAWNSALQKFQTGRLLEASRALARTITAGLGAPRAAVRLRAALQSAKDAPDELVRSEDPLVSLGALFVLASLMRYGKLPPELRYDAEAEDLSPE